MVFSTKQLLSVFLMFSSVLLIQGAAQGDKSFPAAYFTIQEKLAEKAGCHIKINDISCDTARQVDASMRVFKEEPFVEQTKNLQEIPTDYKTLYSGVLAQVNLYGEADFVIVPKKDYLSTSSRKSQSRIDAKLLQEIWDISRELSRFLPTGSVYQLRLNLCGKEKDMQNLRVHFISKDKVDLGRLEKATEVLNALKTGIGRLHGQAQFYAIFDKSLFAVEKKEDEEELVFTLSPPEDDIRDSDAEPHDDDSLASNGLGSTDTGDGLSVSEDLGAVDVDLEVDSDTKDREEIELQKPTQPEESEKPSTFFTSKVLLGIGVAVTVAVATYCFYSWWTKDKSSAKVGL